MNFNFLQHETAMLRPQRIMVKSSEVSLPSLLAVSSVNVPLLLLDKFILMMDDRGVHIHELINSCR